jgi:arylformamidase
VHALASLVRIADLSYGPHKLNTLDVYPVIKPNAPVHIFYHGGYWRAQDKQNFAYIAAPLTAEGICTVIANYSLCPEVTLDGVVASALEGLAWTARHIAQYGGNPDQITLSGHSAGAHLGAAALSTDWTSFNLAPDLVKAATLISGIYDPSPAILTSVNADLRLTEEVMERHNYEKKTPKIICPTRLIAGGREPWQFIDQTYRYAHHLHRHGGDPGVAVSPGFNHFNILDQYLDPQSDVMRAILGMAKGGKTP